MKNSDSLKTILITAVITTAILVTANKAMQPSPTPGKPGSRPIKEISLETAAKLKIDDKDPAVVFSVNKKGEMQAYKIKGAKSQTFGFPLPAGSIESLKSITILKTTNPKTCWTDLEGTVQCIEW